MLIVFFILTRVALFQPVRTFGHTAVGQTVALSKSALERRTKYHLDGSDHIYRSFSGDCITSVILFQMVSFLYGKMANVIVNFFFEKDTFAVKAHRNCRLRLCSESYSSGVSESHSKSVCLLPVSVHQSLVSSMLSK